MGEDIICIQHNANRIAMMTTLNGSEVTNKLKGIEKNGTFEYDGNTI
jgi:hypothetical protein